MNTNLHLMPGYKGGNIAGWVIVTPTGTVYLNTARRIRTAAIKVLCGNARVWKNSWYSKGYRCIKMQMNFSVDVPAWRSKEMQVKPRK